VTSQIVDGVEASAAAFLGTMLDVVIYNDGPEVIKFQGSNGTTWEPLPAVGTTIGPKSMLKFQQKYPAFLNSTNYGCLYFSWPEPEAAAGGTWAKRFFLLLRQERANLAKFLVPLFDAGLALEDVPQPWPDKPPEYVSNTSLLQNFPLGMIGAAGGNANNGYQILAQLTMTHEMVPITHLTGGHGSTFWVTALLDDQTQHAKYENLPIASLKIPGTHDSATYLAKNLYAAQCQWWNLYEQCRLGVRYLDLRFENYNSTGVFWPCHGFSQVGDKLCDGVDGAGGMNTLVGQLKAFLAETNGSAEFVIISLRLREYHKVYISDTKAPQSDVNLFWKTVKNCFSGLCVAAPTAATPMPTVGSMRGRKERFLLFYDDNEGSLPAVPDSSEERTWFDTYAWKKDGIGRHTFQEYDPAVWKTDEDGRFKILNAIFAIIEKNRDGTSARNKFWNAQCQITPTLPSGAPDYPADYADRMNKTVMQHSMPHKTWLANTSIITCDFVTGDWVDRLLWMNYYS